MIFPPVSTTGRSRDPFFENPVTNSAGRSWMGPSTVRAAELHRWKEIGGTMPRTALPETNRKSLQQEGSTSHFPTRRSRSEEEEYGPIRFTRKVRTILWGSIRSEESLFWRSNHSSWYGWRKVPVTYQFWFCNQIPCVILVNLIKGENISKFQFVILTIFFRRPGKQRKSVRTLPSDGNYRGYGENLGRGAIGKSNVESWTWRKLRVIYG